MSKRRTIVCVDADGFGLQVRRLVLETAGHTVLAFTSPEEAHGYVLEHPVDVIMLDGGLEQAEPGLARRFQAASVPIIMLSNTVYPPQTAIGHIDVFMTKGEAPDELLAVIERLARKHSSYHPWLWASGAVVTGAAWFAARAIRRRRHQHEIDTALPEKHPAPEPAHTGSKSARA